MKYKIYYGYEMYENGDIYTPGGNILSVRNHKGRAEVRLRIDGKTKIFILARLVYYVFTGFDIENKNLCVCCKDGDRMNCDLSNLHLEERKNIIHGEGHSNRSKLTDQQTQEIRESYKGKVSANQFNKEGLSLSDLSKKYGVTKSLISQIVKGRCRNKEKYKLK